MSADLRSEVTLPLTKALSSARMLETVALGSSYSCGSANGLPASLMSHAAMMVNV